MLEEKAKLVKKINRLCKEQINAKDKIQSDIIKLRDEFNIPIEISSGILTMRTELENATDYILFCVLSILEEKSIDKFFTEEEIGTYKESKYGESSIKFPITFDMVQIANDQWIGSITVKQLMQFRDEQLIVYNENAQRSLRHIVNGNTEYYKIYLNKKAVQGIQESFNSDSYIPNTITLNIPEDADYYFSNNKLVIRSISHFDILDGYHRYIAMSKNYNLNPSFNYNMELRIVCFQTEKARQFIWQEDQKTKMKKADSDAFNQMSESNKIVERLNMNPSCILSGHISRNECIINSAELSLLIKILWYGNANEKKDVKKSLKVADMIKNGLNAMVIANQDLATKRWDFKFLAITINSICNGIPVDELYDTVINIQEQYTEKITPSIVNKRMLNRLNKVVM